MTSQNSSYLKLSSRQRTYVDARLSGMSQVASAAAAGASRADNWERLETVQAALVERMQATADEVDFSRKDAHDMYMDAYRNSDTAAEQIAAVTAMVKLHGLEKPKVVEHKHSVKRPGEIEFMSTEELLRLANMQDLVLDAEYEVIEDAPQLEPPEVTDDNTEPDPPTLPTVSSDY